MYEITVIIIERCFGKIVLFFVTIIRLLCIIAVIVIIIAASYFTLRVCRTDVRVLKSAPLVFIVLEGIVLLLAKKMTFLLLKLIKKLRVAKEEIEQEIEEQVDISEE